MAALWSSGPSPMTIWHVCVYASLCAPWCNFFPLTNILSDKRVSVSWKEGRRQHRPEGNRGNVRWDCTHRAAGFSHVSSDTWELFYSVGVCRSKRSHIAFKVTHTRYPVNDRDQIMCLDVLQWKVVGVKPVFIWSYPLRPLSYCVSVMYLISAVPLLCRKSTQLSLYCANMPEMSCKNFIRSSIKHLQSPAGETRFLWVSFTDYRIK